MKTDNDITEGGKYYVPEDSEFHPGLIFQRKGDHKWLTETFDANTRSGVLTSVYKVRVKHLDHDDIVECGWRERVSLPGKTLLFQGGVLSDRGDLISIHYNPISKWTLLTTGMGQTIFAGKILNISELRFQMKRLCLHAHKEKSKEYSLSVAKKLYKKSQSENKDGE